MNVEKNKNYTLISSDENTFVEFFASFLSKEKELAAEHLIVQLSNNINTTKEDYLLFLDFAVQKKQNGISFAIISDKAVMDNFPEHFNIVPTFQEAKDILEMEAMERELGF
ncbi:MULTISPECIES: hypothetical protein [unclassified Polaribacter]|uniref:hypothetical protein n=1 Tax=unclassified Polaribacter TaxID=196858 RepID=UPI0011BD931C|nr:MULTISPECIES: hypothetical protein [unclassified Polaribacter]TXD54452.1 hypothetical protein ES043_00980 [Polaribacter sp. IC063]TXD60365.1 hypothetical protein ES044_07810 [Polaribacter sp. IC066]